MDGGLGDFLDASGSSEEERTAAGGAGPQAGKEFSDDPYANIRLSSGSSALRRSSGGMKYRSPDKRAKMQGKRTILFH